MSKFFRTAVLAVAFAAMAVSSASATTGTAMLQSRSPIGTASNTASIAQSTASNLPASSLAVGNGAASVSCPDTTYRITSVTTSTAHIDASFGPAGTCVLSVSGTPVATGGSVDVNCQWTLTFHSGVFNNTTGAGTGGSVDTNCSTTITLESLGCTIHVTAQTKSGISSQNVTTTGANDTSASPWGSKITAAVSGLTYTAKNCPSIPEHGSDGSFTGSVFVRNVWGSL